MNKKLAIVLIALVGIGLYALPSTMALFSGQHSFVNIDSTGNQIDCVKCHGDVKAELGTGKVAVGTSGPAAETEGPHAAFKCEYCHRIEAGSSSGDNAYGIITYTSAKYLNTTGVEVSQSVKLIVSVFDMEAGNIPESLTTVDGNGNVTTNYPASGVNMSGATISGKAREGGYSVSIAYGDSENASGVVLETEPSNMRLAPTYNETTGVPLDTRGGIDTAFNPSKVTWDWAKDSRNRWGWQPNLSVAGYEAINPGSSYHAASLVSCMECHAKSEPMGHYSRVVDGTVNDGKADCENCHYGSSSSSPNFNRMIWAGGFNMTEDESDTGVTEAHMEFVNKNDGMTRFSDKYQANNGACVACHTHVAVDIKYDKPTTYQFDATFTTTGGVETLDNFVATGSNISYSDNDPVPAPGP